MGTLYDVRVMNDLGAWSTDMVTGSERRAVERGRFLLPRTIATEVIDSNGRRVSLL